MRLSKLEAVDVLPITPIPTTDHYNYTMWIIRLGYVSCLHFREKTVKIRNNIKAVLTKKKKDYNNRWSRYQPY